MHRINVDTWTLTALDFDVTQLTVHREVLQVHGTRRSDRQAVHNTENVIHIKLL